MHNVLTQGLLIKLYADIVELRNNFLLPVNVDASEFKSEDDHLHQGLFLSEQVELVKADSEVKRVDGLVDSAYVAVGRLVHLGYKNLSKCIELSPVDVDRINTAIYLCTHIYGPEMFEKAWQIIHASNLSKICTTEDDKKATLSYYKELKVPCKAYTTPIGWIVKATKDCSIGDDKIPAGKFLKSVSYTKADLTPLFK
ncbi:MAG: hypothetical protein JKY54_05525 [Flavobacteriales bacterium]|nr:hypothetical protein [Flavobacteriales bacterium]